MPKQKRHKGLLKRIRMTKSGKVRFRAAFGRHRRSHKSGKLRRSYRTPRFVQPADMRRIRSMLGLGPSKSTQRAASSETAQTEN